MSVRGDVRVAIGLPIRSSREVAAATRVIVFLLQTTRRVELSLVSDSPSRLLRRLPAVLLVAANVDLPPGDLVARERLERTVRIQIERQYTRQGVVDVAYDLEIV
jgi:hypothetical protein